MRAILLAFSFLTCYSLEETEIKETSNESAIESNYTTEVQTQNVFLGNNAVLSCHSNDKYHNFQFWQLPQKESIVGPGNEFDDYKYDYGILTGNLFIKEVTKEEEGTYHCVSEGVRSSDINVRSVRMVVEDNDDGGVNYFKGVVIASSLMVVGGLVYFVQKVRKRRQFQSLIEASAEDDESGDELFTAPGPSNKSGNIVRNKQDDQEPLVEIDIPHISIDLDDDLIKTRKQL